MGWGHTIHTAQTVIARFLVKYMSRRFPDRFLLSILNSVPSDGKWSMLVPPRKTSAVLYSEGMMMMPYALQPNANAKKPGAADQQKESRTIDHFWGLMINDNERDTKQNEK